MKTFTPKKADRETQNRSEEPEKTSLKEQPADASEQAHADEVDWADLDPSRGAANHPVEAESPVSQQIEAPEDESSKNAPESNDSAQAKDLHGPGPALDNLIDTSMRDQHEAAPELPPRKPSFPSELISDVKPDIAQDKLHGVFATGTLEGSAQNSPKIMKEKIITTAPRDSEEAAKIDSSNTTAVKVETYMPEKEHGWDDWMDVIEQHPSLSYHQGEIIRLVGDYKLGDVQALERAKYILNRLICQDVRKQ